MKKLDGFTNIFLPLAWVIGTIWIIQGALKASIFQGVFASIIQVIIFPAICFLFTNWQGKKKHTTFEGAPDIHNEQKEYTTSAFTYVVTGLTFLAALVAVLF